MRIILLSFSLLFLLSASCIKESQDPFGPFKPVDAIEDIIILGNNGHFVAYNIRSKEVEETYSFEEGYAGECGYTAGHLLLTKAQGINAKKDPARYNINIQTGQVEPHSFEGYYFTTCEDENLLESTAHSGFTTYHYNVVKNELDAQYNHPIPCKYSSPGFFWNDSLYWFPDTYQERQNYNCLIHKNEGWIPFGNENETHHFVYRKNNFLARMERNEEQGSKVSLEKIVQLVPLETSFFFQKPDSMGRGGYTETILYEDKVLVFSTSELYLLDANGNILFTWGDPEEEMDASTDHKSFYSRMGTKILDDKLYVFGQRYNSTISPPTHLNCCVEIDLISGEENWIEVWNGW